MFLAVGMLEDRYPELTDNEHRMPSLPAPKYSGNVGVH